MVVGAGAAGLMAAIWAGRTARAAQTGGPGAPPRIVLVDGAAKLGAKILVAGGGRCNVTHHEVDERAFAGSTPAAIRKVLRRFDVARTIAFFSDLGVELKREPTGKLFPVTDRARTVLDALLTACRAAGVDLRHPWRVEHIAPPEGVRGFLIAGPSGEIEARRVIVATGGRSLPKSGSDGHGYAMVKALGHSLTPRIMPALVPLTLPKEHFLCGLSGVSSDVEVWVRSATGRRLASFKGALLCAHFGITGPAVLDVSRYYLDARADDPGAKLIVCWLPGLDFAGADAMLRETGPGGGAGGIGAALARHLPRRLADAICLAAGVDPATPRQTLPREQRRGLAHALVEMELPVSGDRGYTHAEVTAGGVPLSELRLETMDSRLQPGLHVCGEICDVDGRIGGFNFQWAWASGSVAGCAAAAVMVEGTVYSRNVTGAH